MTEIQDILQTDLVDAVDIARVLDMTPRSVTRWQQGEVRPRRDAVDRLLELKAVLDLAQQVMPPESARLWLRGPIPALDYAKPLDLVRNGEFRRVINSLLALAEGVAPLGACAPDYNDARAYSVKP
jgi:putative toxin-antitoxin system antitoxin component (TIGR02293 family)